MLSLHNAEILVHAFVTSRWDYCDALLSGCANSTLKGLQLIQNAAARILTRTRRFEHISLVLASLHWLPVKFHIYYKILLLTFKALHGLAPLYLNDLLFPYTPSRMLRSQGTGLLVIPRVAKSTIGTFIRQINRYCKCKLQAEEQGVSYAGSYKLASYHSSSSKDDTKLSIPLRFS